MAVVAGHRRSFNCRYKSGETAGGAEERRRASPLISCLSFYESFLAVRTEHVS